MSIQHRKSLVMALPISLSLAAGCTSQISPPSVPASLSTASTQGAATTSSRGRGWISPEAKNAPLLYIAEVGFGPHNSPGDVLIYSTGKHPKKMGELTDQISHPESLWVDANQNLYVANHDTDGVVVFPPGHTSPTQMYNVQCSCNIYDVAVDATGVVYIGTDQPAIYEFEPNAPTPFLTITDVPSPIGFGFDHAGNLYVASGATVSFGSDILEFSPGATTGTPLGLQNLFAPTDIVFDQSGNLAVADQELGRARVVFFMPGATQSFRKLNPFHGRIRQVVFDAAGTLYATTSGSTVIVYPNGEDKRATTIPKLHDPVGVAVSPAAPQ